LTARDDVPRSDRQRPRMRRILRIGLELTSRGTVTLTEALESSGPKATQAWVKLIGPVVDVETSLAKDFRCSMTVLACQQRVIGRAWREQAAPTRTRHAKTGRGSGPPARMGLVERQRRTTPRRSNSPHVYRARKESDLAFTGENSTPMSYAAMTSHDQGSVRRPSQGVAPSSPAARRLGTASRGTPGLIEALGREGFKTTRCQAMDSIRQGTMADGW